MPSVGLNSLNPRVDRRSLKSSNLDVLFHRIPGLMRTFLKTCCWWSFDPSPCVYRPETKQSSRSATATPRTSNVSARSDFDTAKTEQWKQIYFLFFLKKSGLIFSLSVPSSRSGRISKSHWTNRPAGSQ